MSTEVKLVDEDAFKMSLQDVRDDKTETKLVIVGHVNNEPNAIDVIFTGPDINEINEVLDDKQVMYVLARLNTTFDLSTTVKFVYIHWVGTNVPFSKKGRFGVVHESVRKYFQPCHLEMETDSTADITEEVIRQKLEDTAGTRSKVRERSEVEGVQERGFTQTQTKKSAVGIPGKSNSSTKMAAVSSQGSPVTVDPEVSEIIKDLRSESSTNWLLAGYEGGNPKAPIVTVGSGDNGLDEMKGFLESDKVLYGLLRVTDLVDDITTVKFVYITWVGDMVKPMTKAKVATRKGDCDQVFLPAHVTVYASESSDLIESEIINKVKSASGTKSHVM
ncbi:uncharacterized protein LOC117306369 [Asterias rubens]|uniref:uncharacterized protein LOC117306369 n=1 Tax=Asterias rubens TaxID=7604 RepID=UPI001455B2E9|nr:uncharacterized protein LOC117306369 [Asterias rubens]